LAGVIIATAFPAGAQTSSAQPTFSAIARLQAPRPRLVVVMSIDQFRGDYLTRYGDLLLPTVDKDGRIGGFRYLMERGAFFVDARHGHYPLFTGPGHAALLTGAYPAKHGVVANLWWDRVSETSTYCVDDSSTKVVGVASGSKLTPMGPRNLRVSTVGDELKLATAGNAKVLGISLKDRAAILMAGHAADIVLWLDSSKDGQATGSRAPLTHTRESCRRGSTISMACYKRHCRTGNIPVTSMQPFTSARL